MVQLTLASAQEHEVPEFVHPGNSHIESAPSNPRSTIPAYIQSLGNLKVPVCKGKFRFPIYRNSPHDLQGHVSIDWESQHESEHISMGPKESPMCHASTPEPMWPHGSIQGLHRLMLHTETQVDKGPSKEAWSSMGPGEFLVPHASM